MMFHEESVDVGTEMTFLAVDVALVASSESRLLTYLSDLATVKALHFRCFFVVCAVYRTACRWHFQYFGGDF